MGLRKFMTAISMVAGLVSISMPAYAWYSIYDSNQYTQNYIKAQKSIEIAMTAAEQLKVMEHQTSMTQDALATLDNLDALTEMEKEVELYNQLKSSDQKLLESVKKALSLFETIKAQWGTSNVSFESFCSSLADSSNQRDKALVSTFKASTVEMQQVAYRRKEILDQLGLAVGQTQAIQAVGAAVDVIIGQNQQIISYMTATAADQVADRNEGKSQVEYSRRVMQEYEARKREAATGFR